MRFCLLIFVFLGVACSPCAKLAEKICDCNPSPSQRTACRKNLSLQTQHKAFSIAQDKDRCEAVLKDPDCTCQAILANQFEKCGFTR